MTNGTDASFDLVVIGSGPGGYVAAIRAAQLGLRTAVVEKDAEFGGTCLHRGCIPTKAWLHTAEVLTSAREAAHVGVRVEGAPTYEPQVALDYRRAVVDKNAKGVAFLLKKNKVQTFHGWGRLDGPGRVVVDAGDGAQAVLQTRNVLLATGSVPRDLPIAPADGSAILNSDQILQSTRVPERLLVLGGGAVGVEFASIFAALGSQVTLVEMLPRLLPLEDEEVSAELARQLRRRGITVKTGVQLDSVFRAGSGLEARLNGDKGPETVETDQMLVAVGRVAVVDRLGLETVGVTIDSGRIAVDGHCRTSAEGVYAIGDCIATPLLAHVASAEGILAVETMAGLEPQPIDYDQVPWCTYCEPEVASVGLSEADARERGYDVAVGKFPFSASGKAALLGRTGGFVKVVRETRYDQVLGVHIIGPSATDLIAEACVALKIESTNEELFRTIHAHPTLSEAVAEAAHVASGHGIHI